MTTSTIPITAEQYRALQCLPSPEQLFDFEIETLVAKGITRYEHADRFRKQKPRGLFLFTPPQPRELDLDNLVSLIEIKGKKGKNYLGSDYSEDKIEVPGPYLMMDIKDGRERLNIDPWISKANILQEGRSPYTIWRGIIHAAVFPESLEDLNMDLVDSPGMPYLCLYEGEPRLESYRYIPYAFPGWGAPSCGSVIV